MTEAEENTNPNLIILPLMQSLDTWAIFDALGMKIKSAKHEIKRTVIEIGMTWNASPGTMQPSLSSRTRLPGVKVNVEWDDARV